MTRAYIKKRPLTDAHDLLYRVLLKGHAHAISKASLVIITGLSERKVRQYIEDLNANGKVVCNLQDGKGYYLPETEDDYVAMIKLTASRANALYRKNAGVKMAYERFLRGGRDLLADTTKTNTKLS